MTRLAAAAFAAAWLAVSCGEDESLPSFYVTSFAFGDGETIPERHTCDGDDLSPPLVFEGAPESTAGYAVVMTELGEDGEADVVRWTLWGIPDEPRAVSEGIPIDRSPGGGLAQGRNDLDVFGYSGPCPDDGDEHMYVFRAYALSAPLDLEPGSSAKHVFEAIGALEIARGELACEY